MPKCQTKAVFYYHYTIFWWYLMLGIMHSLKQVTKPR